MTLMHIYMWSNQKTTAGYAPALYLIEQQIDKVHVILIIEFICAMAYA